MAESDNAKREPLRSSCPFLEEEATGTDMDLPFTASQKVCVFFFYPWRTIFLTTVQIEI